MVVNRALLWVLLVCCCVPSVVAVVRMRLREQGRAAGVDGLLTGLAIGFAVACAVLAVGIVTERLLGW